MQKEFTLTLLRKQKFCICLTFNYFFKNHGKQDCKKLLLTFNTFFHEMLHVTISKTFHLPQLYRTLIKHEI